MKQWNFFITFDSEILNDSLINIIKFTPFQLIQNYINITNFYIKIYKFEIFCSQFNNSSLKMYSHGHLRLHHFLQYNYWQSFLYLTSVEYIDEGIKI